MKTLLIHPGFLEGKPHFVKFISYYMSKNYIVQIHNCIDKSKPKNRDYIHITHSAGILCPLVQESRQPKVIVAPPISNHRIKRKLTVKLFGDVWWAAKNKELLFWMYKTVMSTIYIADYKKWLFLRKSLNEYHLDIDEVNKKHVSIIAGTRDPFTKMLCDDKRCISIDGHHDDLLYRPRVYEKYIQNIK